MEWGDTLSPGHPRFWTMHGARAFGRRWVGKKPLPRPNNSHIWSGKNSGQICETRMCRHRAMAAMASKTPYASRKRNTQIKRRVDQGPFQTSLRIFHNVRWTKQKTGVTTRRVSLAGQRHYQQFGWTTPFAQRICQFALSSKRKCRLFRQKYRRTNLDPGLDRYGFTKFVRTPTRNC